MMTCKVLASDRVVLDAEASSVTCRTPEGWLGILTGHAPAVFGLEDAPLRVSTPEGQQRFRVQRGVVRVSRSGVLVLADWVEVDDA
ncbi:MAG: F0F1 ATP synthase subunit epsilon [Candidatus Bipolaricaulota bacterium]